MAIAYRHLVPAAVNEHYRGMPNAVDALYARIGLSWLPFITWEIEIEARGQLCFDEAAANATAFHMYNNGMRRGFRFVSWRVDMSGPLVGRAKRSGLAPEDFKISNYVHA